MKALQLVGAVAVVCAVSSVAQAQDWRLDDSLRDLTNAQRDALVEGVQKAPERALRDVLDQEAKHLEKLTKDDLEAFGKDAWARLLAGKEEGRLWRAIVAELKAAGVFTKELALKVFAAEKARLHTLPEKAVYSLVDRVLKAALIDRLAAIRDAKLTVFTLDRSAGDAQPANWPFDQPNREFTWRSTPLDEEVRIASSLPLPGVTFFSKKASLEAVLLERTYKTSVGDLKVTAAKVEGLVNAKAGRVKYTDDLGRETEGLGVTFTAKAAVTGLRGDFKSHEVEAASKDLSVSAYLDAMAQLASNVEATSTTLITERGIGSHNEIRAGAGVSATARLPITIDLKVLKIRVIPYVSAHAGVSAGAHATLEVEWTGKARFDIGAHLSTGAGIGGGLIVELELGETVKRALDKLIKKVATLVRPIADALMGRTWKGPSSNTTKLTVSLADLERRWAETGEARPRVELASDAEVAARYAPVLYQQIERGQWDLLRRADFDGDWNTLNNWDAAKSASADTTAWVYYDVRETETHHYVTYTFYHPGRKSEAISPLRGLREHENDLSWCLVVARKGAPRGREVEAPMTSSDATMHAYSNLDPKANGDKTRWSARYGSWNGTVQFVDEADHPAFDMERTHPQVWISGKNHEVYGFNGRDDRDPFSGEEGVVYYPTGKAERPEGPRDAFVGYGLRPLAELSAQIENKQVFSGDDTVRPRGAARDLPARMRGDEGIDDQATPPWAWRLYTQEEDRGRDDRRDDRNADEYLYAGDLFVDPARSLGVLFRLPGGFSRTYLKNPWMGIEGKRGLVEHVSR